MPQDLIVKATFVGKDSCGYHNGIVYNLQVISNGNQAYIAYPHFCPYGSWKAFWRNWEPVYEGKHRK